MSDITFVSMIGMICLGIWLGRGQRPINNRLTGWAFTVFLCFYILVGVFWIAD